MISELHLRRVSPTLGLPEVMNLAEFPGYTTCSLHKGHGRPG
jgi:hypothetical protein